MNLRTLYDEAKKVSPYRSHYSSPGEPFELVEIMPNLSNNTICFVYSSEGITENTNHLSFIEFRNTRFIPDEEFDGNERDYYSVSHEGSLYWVKKHKMTNTVRVNCSCSDFYFTFAYWDWLKHVQYGKKPLPYVRKTTTYPERNPNHYVGICKHLYWAIIDLYELDIMDEIRGL